MTPTVIAAALATCALLASSAFAAGTAAPAATAPTMPQTGTAAAATHPTRSQCEADAKAKGIHGKQLKTFMKDCEAGTATH